MALPALPALLAAQDQASIGAGIGIVRHDNGSSFSAFTLSPAAQRVSASFFISAGGSLSLLERGIWAAQGRGELWAGSRRLAISASLAGSTRSDGLRAGAGSVLGEILWAPPGSRGGGALGMGVVSGVIEATAPVTAFRARARTWWPLGQTATQLSASLEATRFLGGWYVDAVAGVSLDRPRTVASLWSSTRISSVYGSTAAISGTLQYYVTPTVALELSAGNYLRDPFQGLPRAGFGSGAIRIHAAPRSIRSTVPEISPPALQPLIAQHRGGDTVVVRFHMEGARTVAMAGNWNDWSPVALQDLGADIWEATLRLSAGTYYFNLQVDGVEWVVPGGVAVVGDGMGGLVAILTVL